ncbi:MAG: NAD-dependent epimerase/dehydratase family protein [Burkholderiaceae bacterium]
MKSEKNILLTGCAGFIGMHTARALLDAGYRVTGIDNVNDYYDPKLKHDRLSQLQQNENFSFKLIDISKKSELNSLESDFALVVNLAAQAGVRYSLTHPEAYVESNLAGFVNVLEFCRNKGIGDLVYASSSSVYGVSSPAPFSESAPCDKPISLYAATKKANELFAYTYGHLYQIKTVGLRFFTVYGPWGRPDMAYFKFAKALYAGTPIEIFNNGNLSRDFTYIDDIVKGITGVIDKVRSERKEGAQSEMSRVLNIGNQSPVNLKDFIECMEVSTGRTFNKRYVEMQAGDVYETHANIEALSNWTGFSPTTSIEEGIPKFIEWFREYNGIE